MCDFCGCQRVPALGALAREHDRMVELIVAARAAHRDGDVARMAHLAQRILNILTPHGEVEERGLFPALQGDLPEQMAALRREHRGVVVVLAAAGDAPSWDCAWASRLLGALDMLHWHILKEQDGVFPAALATLHTADWAALDVVRDRVDSKLPRTAEHPDGAQGSAGRA
jgi:hypothetical protein